MLHQSVFERLAGDDDVNDAERLCRNPAMRWVVGDRAIASSHPVTASDGCFHPNCCYAAVACPIVAVPWGRLSAVCID